MSQTATMLTLGMLASERIRARQRPPVPMQPTRMVSLAPRTLTAGMPNAATAAVVFNQARRERVCCGIMVQYLPGRAMPAVSSEDAMCVIVCLSILTGKHIQDSFLDLNMGNSVALEQLCQRRVCQLHGSQQQVFGPNPVVA